MTASTSSTAAPAAGSPEQIADAFRQARLGAVALAAYPGGVVPATLEEAYVIQDLAIENWPDAIVGWKVATIQPDWRARYPGERLAGPVFSRRLEFAGQERLDAFMIEGGFAAVEAEFAIHVGAGFPMFQRFDDVEQLRPFVDGVHAAIEIAGSPLATLTALGPGSTISDFGNNAALIIGAPLTGYFDRDDASWTTGMTVNDSLVGEGSAARLANGPMGAMLFLANNLFERGLTLRPGDWISTGASTGIHQVKVGDLAQADFAGLTQISVRMVQAPAQ
jgi:2-keto-4-pentenoate hydratase